MNNYAETNLSATTYKRCPKIEIYNPLNSLPNIMLVEEQVITAGGLSMSNFVGMLAIGYDPEGVIDIYDPTTGQKTNATISHNEIMALLYSIYMTAATKRDSQITG